MSREQYIRSSLFLALADTFPPLVKDAILSDDSVTRQFSLSTDGILTFGPTNTSFVRSKVFGVIRRALETPGKEETVEDQEGGIWSVRYSEDDDGFVVLTSGANVLRAAHLCLLASAPQVRMATFASEIRRVNLPAPAIALWEGRLRERALSDDEMGEFVSDINLTPTVIASAISEHLGRGNISINVLVPKALEYYRRLIGNETGHGNLAAFLDGPFKTHVADLLSWNELEGMRQALLCCSHSLAVAAIGAQGVESQVLDRVVQETLEKPDPFSLGGLNEILLMRSLSAGDAATAVVKIAELLAKDGEDDGAGLYAMLSVAFFVVYGELSQSRVIVGCPLYWQRMAAFAQASLITREIAGSSIKRDQFMDWMRALRTSEYVAQVYVDMRIAPAWQPQFALASQLRNEIVGRVIVQAGNLREQVEEVGISDLLLGEGPDSLRSKIDLYLGFMPGPLEGDITLVRELSDDQIEQISRALDCARPTVKSFAPLVNSALVFKVPASLADLAAEALRRTQFQIEFDGDKRALSACLAGLATTASVSRSVPLAEAVQYCLRVYRRPGTAQLPVDEVLRTGMIACAAREDFNNWCKHVGEFIADLGFQSISAQEASGLQNFAVTLCGIVPELWAACGPGIAAFEATAG